MFRAILNGSQEREGFYLYGDKGGGSASRNMRSDIFANELGNSVVVYKADPLVTPTSPPGQYFINLKGRIEIHYQKGFAQANTYKDAPYPISWLEVTGGKVKVRENGMVMNPQDLIFSGDMIASGFPICSHWITMLKKPSNCKISQKPPRTTRKKSICIPTNPIITLEIRFFFKGYFAYGNSYLRDELSKVLHVELISGDRDIVIEKKNSRFAMVL